MFGKPATHLNRQILCGGLTLLLTVKPININSFAPVVVQFGEKVSAAGIF